MFALHSLEKEKLVCEKAIRSTQGNIATDNIHGMMFIRYKSWRSDGHDNQ